MAFVPNPTPPQFTRVVNAGTIRATRRSRPWLWFFMLGVLGLAIGTAFLVWPLARVTVVPVVEPIAVAGTVKVDLDARQAVPESGVVPGSVLGQGNTVTTVLKGVRTVRLAGSILTYVGDEADAAVAAAAARAAGDEYVVQSPLPNVSWGTPQEAASGKLVTLPYTVTVQRYRRFPVAQWRTRLKGMDIIEAEIWLKQQPGISSAQVALYPSIFSKVSQKVPRNDSAITLSLDINGKVSILE